LSPFVFVLSPERSGSTLLSVVLGAHSRVIAPPELHLLRFSTLSGWRTGWPPAQTSLEYLARESRCDLSDLGDDSPPLAVYERIAAALPPDKLVVDKTPAYARETSTLERLETLSPRYVWLIRHPLAVAASRLPRTRRRRSARNQESWSYRLKYPAFVAREWWRDRTGENARQQCEYWMDVHTRIRGFLAEVEPARHHLLHYEDLVREPRATASALARFLKLELEEAMLDPRGQAPADLRWGIGDEKVLQHSGFEVNQIDAWRARVPERHLPDAVRRFATDIGARL